MIDLLGDKYSIGVMGFLPLAHGETSDDSPVIVWIECHKENHLESSPILLDLQSAVISTAIADIADAGSPHLKGIISGAKIDSRHHASPCNNVDVIERHKTGKITRRDTVSDPITWKGDISRPRA